MRNAARQTRHAADPRAALALGLAVLSGCGQGNGQGHQDPDLIEVAAMSPGNVIPKSSPKELVETFRSVCLAASPSEARAELRAQGYARSATTRATEFEGYVVDDARPAVVMRPDAAGSHCAVVAAPRTGQANAVDDFVAARFPSAERRQTKDTERYWALPGAVLFTQRSGRFARRDSYTLGILRPSQPTPTAAN